MATPHIFAPDGAFAPVVLLPGDPLRAAYIADRFLDEPVQVTNVRNCAGFTGLHQGRTVSVMASGMGMPSAAIYVTELYRHYGVETVIRVGTAGMFAPDMELRSIVLAADCITNSAVPRLLLGNGWEDRLLPTPDLYETALDVAARSGLQPYGGTVFSTDLFYDPDEDLNQRMADDGVVAVEMEAAALYAIASLEGKRSLAIMTTTDHLIRDEHLGSDERQSSLDEMIEFALAVAVADSPA
jgi:purine-nucleoside phosphorylase